MEIGYQPVHGLKAIARRYEYVRIAAFGVNNAVFIGHAFKRAAGRCANGYYPAPVLAGAVYPLGRFFAHFIIFAVHMVFFHVFRRYRTERAKANVQQHIRYLNAHILHLLEQLLRKMQPRGGCCGGAVLLGINGLVALLILQPLCYVRRQRRFAAAVKHLFKYAFIMKIYYPAARVGRGFDLYTQFVRYLIYKAGLCALARAYQRLVTVVVQPFEQQKLHQPACILPVRIKARGYNAGGVAHQYVPRP